MATKTRETIIPSTDTGKTGTHETSILIIQSASRVLTKTLESLQQEFPKAHFTILTAKPDAISGNERRILPLPAGRRISLFSYGINKRRQLRRLGFDMAVVLYNIENGQGYANVESLALSTGAKELRGYFPDGSFQKLSGKIIRENIFREQTAIGWVVLNVVTAIFLILVSGIAMVGEAVYRRLTRKSSATQTSRPL